MKLAFNNKAHYADFDTAYDLYVKRSKSGNYVDKKLYKRIIRQYCEMLAERFIENGFVDLPHNFGQITAVQIIRKPQYRGKQFIGYGGRDWNNGGQFDGKLKTFGITYLPKYNKHKNLRCLGFVANRQLFKKVKAYYLQGKCTWSLLDFNDDMI